MSIESNDIEKVAFYSGFLPDKVFPEKYTGSMTVIATTSDFGAGRVSTKTIPQPHGANVFPVMLFSIDGSNWFDGGQAIQTGLSITMAGSAYTNSSSIVVMAVNYTKTQYTLQYKIALISDD